MGEDNLIQLYAFVQMLYGGLLIGLCYDLMNFLLYSILGRRHLSDTVFWLVTLVISATVFFRASGLFIRVYLLTGLLLGWGIYFIAISPLINFLLDSVKKAASGFLHILFAPFRKLASKWRFKHEKQLSRMKRGAKKIRNLPKETKVVYNKYSKYFFKKRDKERGNAQEKEF